MFDNLKKVKKTKSITVYFSEGELDKITKAMAKEDITNRSGFIEQACMTTVCSILNIKESKK